MQTVDRARLNTDLSYRVAFSCDFIEFTVDDQDILHKAAPLILPVITEVSGSRRANWREGVVADPPPFLPARRSSTACTSTCSSSLSKTGFVQGATTLESRQLNTSMLRRTAQRRSS